MIIGRSDIVLRRMNGEYVASGSDDNTVLIRSAATGQLRRELTDYVRSVAFSPNGERVANGSFDKTIRIWDAATGQLQRELRGTAKRPCRSRFLISKIVEYHAPCEFIKRVIIGKPTCN